MMENKAKLKLNLDDLQIESFETSATDATRPGTVWGYETESPGDTYCGSCDVCSNGGTCDASPGCASGSFGCGGGGSQFTTICYEGVTCSCGETCEPVYTCPC
jgi:hypothetical protein